jgi:hypothetical protein
MGDDFADPLHTLSRGGFWKMKQQVLPEGNGPPVFHGAEGKIRNGNKIHFRQGVVDAVKIFTEGQGLAPEAEPETRGVAQVRQRRQANPRI